MLTTLAVGAGCLWIGAIVCQPDPDDLFAGPTRIVLEETDSAGPSGERFETRTVTARFDGRLHLSATSDVDVQLILMDDRGRVVVRDDNSGGGTDAYLEVRVRRDRRVSIQIAGRTARDLGEVTLRVVESIETPITREAARVARARLVDLRSRAEDDADRESDLASCLAELRAAEGWSSSPAIQGLLTELARFAETLAAIELAIEAIQPVRAYYELRLPPLHPVLQAMRLYGARLSMRVARFEEARSLAELAVVALTKARPEDDLDLIRARLDLTEITCQLGELDLALRQYEEILTILESSDGPTSGLLPGVRQNRAAMLLRLGHVEAALRSYEEILESLADRHAPNDPAWLVLRLNRATCLIDLGLAERARPQLEDILRRLREGHRHSVDLILNAQVQLARAAWNLGDWQAARELEEEVLTARAQALPAVHPDLQTAQHSLAVTLLQIGELARARSLLEQVLEKRAQYLSPDHRDIQEARLNLALLLGSLGDHSSAEAQLRQVVPALERTLPGDHLLLQRARGQLAWTLEQQGHLDAAQDLQDQVLATLERTLPDDHPELQRIRGNCAWTLIRRQREPERRVALVRALIRGTHDHLARLALELSPREIEAAAVRAEQDIAAALSLTRELGKPGEDLAGECWALVETARAAAATSLRTAQWIANDRDDARLAELRTEIARAGAQIVRRSLLGGTELYAAVQEQSEARRALREHLRERLGEPAESRRLLATQIAAVLPEGTAAIGYWRYDRISIDPETRAERAPVPSYVAFVLRRNQPIARVELGDAAAIEEAVTAWRATLTVALQRGLTTSEQDPWKASQEKGTLLAERILAPLKSHLSGQERLVVVPDDALHAIPFDSLPSGEVLLGERYRIIHRTTLKELAQLNEAPLAEPSLLALGDIDYDRPPDAAPAEDPANPRARRVAWTGRLAWERSFGYLPETKPEVLTIARYFERRFEKPAQVLLESAASREAFESWAPRSRYLHLASHAYFAPESVPSMSDRSRPAVRSHRDLVTGFAPMVLCGLAFAGANLDPEGDAALGILTAAELATLDLSACELAVLSACDTSVGIRRAGQGLASLQAALLAAGVHTTITSLWKVPDAATRALMTDFYRRHWIQEKPKAQALFEAKLALRRQLDDAGRPKHSPRDWAGWILSGDPD